MRFFLARAFWLPLDDPDIKHGSITFMPLTINLQLHLILPITITITIAFSCL